MTLIQNVQGGPALFRSVTVSTQPASTATSGTAFGTQPVFQLAQLGVAIAMANVTITVAIVSGSGTLSGTATLVTDASGKATATNLAITGTGEHTIGGSATAYTRIASNAITVSAAGSLGPAVAKSVYYNSRELGGPSGTLGGDGSDANCIWADSFHPSIGDTDAMWYGSDCDTDGWSLANKGYCGSIYANPITPTNAINLDYNGVGGKKWCADTGNHTGDTDVNLAMHRFSNGGGGTTATSYDEITARWYYKAASGYQWGAQKSMNFTKEAGDITWFNIQFNCGAGSASSTATPSVQIIHGEGICDEMDITLQSGRWYMFEVYIKLNSSGTTPDGILKIWIDDCGTDGLTHGVTQTLLYNRSNVAFDRNQSGCNTTPCKIDVLWMENWANPVSSGRDFWDYVYVRKGNNPIGWAF